ncbi:serine carboxypeptidase-like 46 isoform X2 [Quercus robur]|uniref:serine carboxypeptidase-like 46 isoform X2 n=1 Tax=Quercus robur TaxID=38942 RepID=UPI002162723F|nr:serine carboxypeptidase-like 46 isoform X2 [Quercus robur]
MTLRHYHANSSKIATPPTLDLFENKHLQGLLSETKELLFSLSSSRSIMQSQRWIVMGIICATFIHFLMPVEPFPIADKITSLPGQPQVSFQQFAGYITVDEKQNRALFYYFVEAESQPASKPLVLWLNGGPGCSSVGAGALLEHGPFKVRGDNLVRNEYNWNKEANMLYLESPAGVGFSYSANKSFYTYVNDEITARDNLIFLQRWFVKYPKYRAKEFFITGESYAGHYVPQLAQLIVQSNLKINLKGIAVGNALLDFTIDFDSRDEYYWSHGLISDDNYQFLTKSCNGSAEIIRKAMNQEADTKCLVVYARVKQLTNTIDQYDVTADVCLSPVKSQMDMLYEPLLSKFQTLLPLHSKPNALNQQEADKKELVCGEGITEKYLNRKDVQKALHAQLVGINEWGLCRDSDFLQYDEKNREISIIGVIVSLVKSGIRVFIYRYGNNWRSRCSNPIYRVSDTSKSISKGDASENNCAIQSMVRGKTGWWMDTSIW